MTSVVERFAPSPTGLLHLGHAFSALTAWRAARKTDGRFILRMDDLDQGRSKPRFVDCIEEDLRWLGVQWDGEVLFQSKQAPAHQRVLNRLRERGLVYPCTCTRKEIIAAVGAPQEGAELGPAYPGTCRDKPVQNTAEPSAWRLNMRAVMKDLKAAGRLQDLSFFEIGAGPRGETGEIEINPDWMIEGIGDVVLQRKDGAIAYHLAVVIDDAFQSVSHVTRGNDLFASTHIHRVLQVLTGLPRPLYRHHKIIRDDTGRRLAKREDDVSLQALRRAGAQPSDIRHRLGFE